jgi:hypothetical protein
MPREIIGIVLFYSICFGLLWGVLSLFLWTQDVNAPGVLIAPLWLTAYIGAATSLNVYLVAGTVCALLGIVLGLILLGIARWRGA